MSATGAHSRQRLAAISHHFLGEGTQSLSPGAKRPAVVPVFSIRVERPLPFALFTQAFLARGKSVTILDVSRERPNVAPPDPSTPPRPDQPTSTADSSGGGSGPALGDKVMGQVAALEPPSDICLVPMAYDQWPVARGFGRLLLVVGCCREGVESAYQLIKRLHGSGRVGPVGVTMADAASADEAARYFDTLAQACDRFLQMQPVSYGYLPKPLTGYAPVDLLDPDTADGGLGSAVGGIAGLLCGDLFDGSASVVSKRPVEEAAP